MLKDSDMIAMIDKACEGYTGDGQELAQAVAVLVVGRLYGWRVMRLISPRKTWTLATALFGDPKELLPERGKLAHRSVGLAIADKAGEYWEFIKGTSKAMPLADRKRIM